MRKIRRLFAVGMCCALWLVTQPLTRSQAQGGFTIRGFVGVMTAAPQPPASSARTMAGAQTSAQQQTVMTQSTTRLTAKLYFPKERGKPVLLTYPNATGAFSFANLAPDNYLLEIYAGEKLLYQRKLALESDLYLTVPLGKYQLVNEGNVAEKTAWVVPGAEFNKQILISVGDIDLKKDTNKLAVTISPAGADGKPTPKTRPLFTGALPNTWLAANFVFNNKRYLMAGTIRRANGRETLDCEIYRQQ